MSDPVVVEKFYLLRDEEAVNEAAWEQHVSEFYDFMEETVWEGSETGITLYQDGGEIEFAPQGSWLALMSDGTVRVFVTEPEIRS